LVPVPGLDAFSEERSGHGRRVDGRRAAGERRRDERNPAPASPPSINAASRRSWQAPVRRSPTAVVFRR